MEHMNYPTPIHHVSHSSIGEDLSSAKHQTVQAT